MRSNVVKIGWVACLPRVWWIVVLTPVKLKTIKLVFAASPLSLDGSESGKCIRAERHVYTQTVVSVNCHYKNPTKCVGIVHRGHHRNVTCSLHDISVAKILPTWH